MLCPCIFLTGKYEGGNFKISFPVLCLCYSLKLFSVLYLCYEILEHHVPGFLLNTNNGYRRVKIVKNLIGATVV